VPRGGAVLALGGTTTISTTDSILFANGTDSSAISGSGSLDLDAGDTISLGNVGAEGSELSGLILDTGHGDDLTLYGSIYTDGDLDFSTIGVNGNADVIIADGATVTLETDSGDGYIYFSDNDNFDTAIEGETLSTGSLIINSGIGAVRLGEVGQNNSLGSLAVTTTGEFTAFEPIETTGNIDFLNMTNTTDGNIGNLIGWFGLFNAGNINITGSGNLTINTTVSVDIQESITTQGGNVNVTSNNSYIRVREPLTTNGGNATFISDSYFYLDTSRVIDTHDAAQDGAVSITASDLYLYGTINSGSAITTISDVSGGIRIGNGSNGLLRISNDELGRVTAGELILSSVNDVHFFGVSSNTGGYDFSGPDLFTINAPNTFIYDYVNLFTTTVSYDFTGTNINEGIPGDDSRLHFGWDYGNQDIEGDIRLGNIGNTTPIDYLEINTSGTTYLNGDILASGVNLAYANSSTIELLGNSLIDTSFAGFFNTFILTTGSPNLSSIDGNFSLTLVSGTGESIAIGNAGQTRPLAGLDITSEDLVDVLGDVDVTGFTVDITARDFYLPGSLTTGSGLGAVNISTTAATGMAVGSDGTLLMDISELEIRNITTDTLTLTSLNDMSIQGIDASDPAVDINTITLISNGIITMGAPVVFNSLNAFANDGIEINANLTTVGDLVLDADANDTADTNDNITMGNGAELTSGGSLVLAATSGDGIVLDGDFTIIHNGSGVVDLSDIAVNSDPSQSNLYTLTINAALNNSEVILSDIGTTLALSGLVINNGTGLVTIGGSLMVQGDISLTTSELEINANTSINTSGGNGALDFSSVTINGDNSGFYSLNLITGDGSITLGDIGTGAMLSSLAIDSTGQTLLTGDIRTGGVNGINMSAAINLSLSGAITLDTRTGNGLVDFSNGVTDGDLTILAGAGEVLLGSSGENADLATLIVDTTGQITLGGGISTTSGDVDFSNAANIILNSNATIDSAGAVDFTGAAVTGSGALTIIANGGSVTLDSVGASNARLTSLNITSAGPTSLNGDIYTTDNINLSAANSALIQSNLQIDSLSGSIDLSTGVSGNGDLSLQAGSDISLGSFSGNGNLGLQAGGDISLESVSGDGELALEADGDISLGSVDGSSALTIISNQQTTLLGNLTIAGNIDLSDASNVSLNADITMDARGGNGSVLLNGGSVDGNQILSILSGNGAVNFGNIGHTVPLAGLNVTTTGSVNLNGNIFSQGDIDLSSINNVVLLRNSSIDSSINDGIIDLAGVTVNGTYEFTLNAGAGMVNLGGVGDTTQLRGLTIIGGETFISGSITTNGDVDLSGASLEGETSLVINAGSGGVALGAVGQATALTSLTAIGTGQSSMNGNITTQGSGGLDLSGLDNILLGDNIIIDSTVNNGSVNISGGNIDGPFTLTINAANGTSTLGTMGQSNALASLTVNASGQVYLDGNITTQGPDGINLSSASNIDLISDSVLTSATTGGVITLDGGAIDGNFALTVDTGDAGSLLLGPVGQNDPLSSLTIIGNGLTTLGADIATQGTAGIDLGRATNVVMLTDVDMDTSAGDGTVRLTGGVFDGNFTLNINSGEGNILLNDLGQIDALAALMVTGTGTTTLSGNINTQGIAGIDMSAASNINLTSDVVLNSSIDDPEADGSINFAGSNIDGNFNLALNSGAGAITLGSIGQNTALAGLAVTNTSQLDLNENISVDTDINLTSGEITQNQNITSNTGNISLVSAGSITMDEAASSNTNGGSIEYTADAGSVNFTVLDADTGAVNINASSDILSVYGTFTNIVNAPTNIIAGQTTLSAGNHIGASTSEPITVDIGAGGAINLSFGASKAYINNLNGTFIGGPDSNRVIDVLADRLAAAAQGQSTINTNGETTDSQEHISAGEGEETNLLVVQGSGLLTEYSPNTPTEESTSSLVPDVPLLIRTKNGWSFKRGARTAIDKDEEQKRKQRTVEWL